MTASGPGFAAGGGPAGYPDPGAIAVARGLAHRDPDGSVTFDLRQFMAETPAPTETPSAPWGGGGPPPGAVQRQEAAGPPEPAAEPAAAAEAAAPATGGAPPVAATPAAAPLPSGPQLEELARQLFEPLAARLKTELRLDRERAGLLTDLRQ
jgi:hypothetical protein